MEYVTGTDNKRYAVWEWDEITTEGHMARLFCLWFCSNQDDATRRYNKHMYDQATRLTQRDDPTMTDAMLKQHLANGIKELMEKGVVEAAKDGMGGWTPSAIYPGRIRDPKDTGSPLVLGDMM